MRRKAARQATCCAVGISPAGWLGVVAGPDGLLEILLAPSEDDVRARLARYVPPLQEGRQGLCGEALDQLESFLSGTRRHFNLSLDLGGESLFARAVLTALLQVPVGSTVSYGELARRAGYPGAARAVGRVMAGNPLPLVIPCHRVIGASGDLTGYSGGSGVVTKEWLLDFERQRT